MVKRMVILPLMAAVLLLAGFSCNHTAAVTSRGVAATVQGLQQSEIVLHNQGKITDAEHKLIQTGFLNLGQAGIAANQCIGNGGGSACIDPVISAMNDISNGPIVGVKNPDTQKQLQLAAQAVIVALQNLKAAL